MGGYSNILVIDADAHVMEPAEAFHERYFDPAFRDRRPRIVEHGDDLFWLVDEQLFPRLKGANGLHYMGIPPRLGEKHHPFTKVRWINHESRELSAPAERLKVMDEHGIDIQVIHTSFFFAYPESWGGGDPKLGSAICSAYNRWIAERCAEGRGRLGFSAVVCLDDVAGAVAEVHRAKALGAASIFVNGTIGERKLTDPAHAPFFEALCEADISLSMHIGWSFPPLTKLMDSVYEARVISLLYPLLWGFCDMVSSGVMERYDTLRVGVLETGCDWIPFMMDQMDNIYEVVTGRLGWPARGLTQLPTDYVKQCDRLFFNTEPESKLLPFVLGEIGNKFVLGSDMPHTETTDHRSKQKVLLQREDVSEGDKRKILETNALAFFRMKEWETMKPRAMAAE